MDATADELAGVVDLFGGLTRAELERALSEAAYRADGQSVDEDALEAAIEDALASFALVRYARHGIEDADEPLLVAGPTAFPSVPEHAEDVPHILDVDRRRLDREALGETAREQFREALEEALPDDSSGDVSEERLRRLLDVSYDIEAWAPVELDEERRRLEDALE
ncbi:DUF7109 family protein [Halopiger xanaduensis]|uniref:Uncharacterized protein n=1 Tax=Halopiger xanaduensis (strain DSM 18323 / JCM 14033 / SH-6) TaxID=797210 RepID=F8D4A7_HALXS|nr:hypothetical protein [Halopiger xanaduensis]AEH38647.1 hypothetical protein Halxa_4042 [Halopiger xanaduensis SH-6]